MTDLLPQDEVKRITKLVQPAAQARALRKMGYIVLDWNPRGEVRALATHPQDPLLKLAEHDEVVLNLP